jgi:hypothetical protein
MHVNMNIETIRIPSSLTYIGRGYAELHVHIRKGGVSSAITHHQKGYVKLNNEVLHRKHINSYKTTKHHRIISHHHIYHPQPSHPIHPPSLLIRIPKNTLHRPANSTIFREILPNDSLTRQRASDFLSNASDRAVFGESSADGAFGVEHRGAFAGLVVAGEGGGGEFALGGGVSGWGWGWDGCGWGDGGDVRAVRLEGNNGLLTLFTSVLASS